MVGVGRQTVSHPGLAFEGQVVHGLVMVQFRSFVEAQLGPGSWEALAARAGLAGQSYFPDQAYPDEELGRLVAAAREQTKIPSPELIESFGEFLVPALVRAYGEHFRPEWTALDVIEHTEEAIHRMVRQQSAGAAPPPLRATRVSGDEVRVSYTSARRLCALARGICRGLGRHFDEPLEIEEPSCMLRGERTCEIVVRRAARR